MQNEIYFNLCLIINDYKFKRRIEVEREESGVTIYFYNTSKEEDIQDYSVFFTNDEFEKIYKFFKNNG